MAGVGAIYACGLTIVKFLEGVFLSLPEAQRPSIQLITTKTLQAGSHETSNYYTPKGTLTLLLYRVDLDAAQRNHKNFVNTPPATAQERVVMPLELRFLLTSWAEEPLVQQLNLGRALAALGGHMTFGPGDLVPAISTDESPPTWVPGESFQFVTDDMALEDRYQIWQALGRPFELSMPFKARVIFLETQPVNVPGAVLERHLIYGTAGPEEATT